MFVMRPTFEVWSQLILMLIIGKSRHKSGHISHMVVPKLFCSPPVDTYSFLSKILTKLLFSLNQIKMIYKLSHFLHCGSDEHIIQNRIHGPCCEPPPPGGPL